MGWGGVDNIGVTHDGTTTAVVVVVEEEGEEEVEGGGRQGPTAVSPDLARDRPSGPTDVMGEGLWKATRPTSSSGASHWREGVTGSYGDR